MSSPILLGLDCASTVRSGHRRDSAAVPTHLDSYPFFPSSEVDRSRNLRADSRSCSILHPRKTRKW